MNVSELFLEEMEPALNQWIRKFTSPIELFSAIDQLYANINAQNIQGLVEDGAIVVGRVHIGAGSVVHGHAIIRGPVIVGTDTVVNSHTEIQPGCFVGSNCIIGHGCTIVKSMVMNNAVVGPAAFVRNSVIGFGTVVGPGAVLGANKPELLKRASLTSSELGVILGDYSAVGANSTLKPGTVVGSRTIIGEAVLADGTYECDQTVTISQKLEINPMRG
jgi:UDP-N-acetylglucosamine diphosphorylase / glucose-1-phosphate thymidylyltransferase / UDP-N-acetylgalactosamine diphosphorylase / glucosamine-1-phosphate N-acetyltransferase / galactosamine-1-phosphate N-acetyltransferase